MEALPLPGHREHHHRHRSHQRHQQRVSKGQAGSEEIAAAAPQQAADAVPQAVRLWRKANAICNRQLSWVWPQETGPASGSWCWHWRHLLFEDLASTASWHCRGELPSSCRWQGQLLAENVLESWQWRLPTAAWQSQAESEPVLSDLWLWDEAAGSWAWRAV